jgi:glycosyltransferase involved in cell wall biosynthesis
MAAFRGPPGTPVLPPWAASSAKVDEERLLEPSEPLTSLLGSVDVLMIGYFTQLLELKDVKSCPGAIVYWDQGHEHIFGDPTANADWDRVFHVSMHLPIALLSVSDIVRDILAHHFARVAPVVPNAIDSEVYHPGPAPLFHPHRATPRFPVDPHGPRRVLIVGNPGLRLKNFDTAMAVLERVHLWLLDDARKQGLHTPQEAAAASVATLKLSPTSTPSPQEVESTTKDVRVPSPMGLSVTWICQMRPGALPSTFPVRLVVNPPQESLPGLYREGYDCLLFCSAYEAWGMPVLEAMASGVPVVTSRCHGVDMFASHRYNCLTADPFDVDSLARCVFAMLTRPSLQSTFCRRARDVASKRSWDATMSTLETALYQIDRTIGRGGASGGLVSDRPDAASAHSEFVPVSAAPTGGPGAGSQSEAAERAKLASKILASVEATAPASSTGSSPPSTAVSPRVAASDAGAVSVIVPSSYSPVTSSKCAVLDSALETVLQRVHATIDSDTYPQVAAALASRGSLSTEPSLPAELFSTTPLPSSSGASPAAAVSMWPLPVIPTSRVPSSGGYLGMTAWS